jgi:hypothetical protein
MLSVSSRQDSVIHLQGPRQEGCSSNPSNCLETIKWGNFCSRTFSLTVEARVSVSLVLRLAEAQDVCSKAGTQGTGYLTCDSMVWNMLVTARKRDVTLMSLRAIKSDGFQRTSRDKVQHDSHLHLIIKAPCHSQLLRLMTLGANDWCFHLLQSSLKSCLGTCFGVKISVRRM